MEYTIGRTKRNWIIVSAVFLIVSQVFWALYFYFNVPVKVDPLQIVLQGLLHLIPKGFILLVFMDYFRHHRLKALQWITLGILVLDLLTHTRTFINLIDPIIPTSVLTALVGAWTIAQIVWVIFLFLPDQKNYPALVPIRWFSFGFLLILLLGIVPLLIKPSNLFATHQLLSISYAVPYFFAIWFAMSIPSEQVTAVDERVEVVEDSVT